MDRMQPTSGVCVCVCHPLVAQWIALWTTARLPRVRIPGLPESVCVPTLSRYGLRGKIHKLVKSVIDSKATAIPL